jgi:O-antigen/teichoic acid export membrane protein
VRQSRAAADIGIQIVLRVLNLGLGIVVTLILVRALGDEGFGQWATVFAVSEIVGYLGEFGLEQLAVRRAAAEREREADWVGALITLRLAIGVPLALASIAVLIPISVGPEMRATAVLISATIVAGALSSARTIFQLRVRNDISMAIVTLNSVAWTVAVVALARGDGGMVAFAVAFLVILVATNALEFLIAKRMAPIHLRHSRELWRPLIRAGVPLGLAGLLTIAYVRIDSVLVFAFLGAEDAGAYSAVYRVLDRVQFIPAVIMTTLFPLIAAAWPSDAGRAGRIIQLAVNYLGFAALPALAFSIVAATPIVEFLFGEEFTRAAPVLPILMGAFIAISYYQLALNLIIVLGLQRRLVVLAAAGLVVNVVLNVALIPSFGFIAAAWITLVTEAMVAGLALALALRAMNLRPSLSTGWRAAIAAAVMALAVYLLREQGASIAVLFAAGATVYLAGLVALGAFSPREAVGLFRSRL